VIALTLLETVLLICLIILASSIGLLANGGSFLVGALISGVIIVLLYLPLLLLIKTFYEVGW